jgi:hypothetical protein
MIVNIKLQNAFSQFGKTISKMKVVKARASTEFYYMCCVFTVHIDPVERTVSSKKMSGSRTIWF